MLGHYDKDGKPITMMECAELFEDKEYRRVEWTELGKDEYVSTVWLGLDHGFGEERPLIFESMAFYDDDWRECRRYSTLEEAKEGHQKLVEEVVAKRKLQDLFKTGNLRVMDA